MQPQPSDRPRARRALRGTTLIEAVVALAVLGVVILFGTSFFVKRRELERER